MKNMKRWKRLLAVGMCSAMMFSMSVGVSATENQDTEETTVAETQEEEETAPEEETVLKGDSCDSANVNDESLQIEEDVMEKKNESEAVTEVTETQEDSDSAKEMGQDLAEEKGEPELLTPEQDFDGINDVVFKLKNTTDIEGMATDMNGVELTELLFERSSYQFLSHPIKNFLLLNSETGELTVKGYPLWQMMKMGDKFCDVTIEFYAINNENNTRSLIKLKINYTGENWETNEEKPELINTSYEFDGTQDMVFNFKNGTGDNAIVSVEQVFFNIKEQNNADENGSYLAYFYIGNYGVSYNYDIEKGQVTLFKHAVSALVHSDRSDWEAVKNVYGNCCITVKLANGEIRTLYGGEGADWTVKVLERSPEESSQHVVNLTESLNEFDADQMQNLIDINKNADVVLRTPEGVTFTFAKGTMRMIDGKDGYPFGVEIIADFSKSGIKNTNVESSVFACRINFEYSGELPGTAKISIPVDNKWNGQTLYYYQVMEDGTLKDTGKSGKVENGIFDVFQSHCSDYVLLAKSPKELGVTENTDNDNNNNNTGNGNNQTGNGNTQGSGNNSTTQVKPVDTTKTSPKTGDNNMILLFAVLCAGSCVVGVSTLKARRKIR